MARPVHGRPGYSMYYLNVMADPSPERVWLTCDDPAHAWIKDTWADQPVDTRLPLYTAPVASGATVFKEAR